MASKTFLPGVKLVIKTCVKEFNTVVTEEHHFDKRAEPCLVGIFGVFGQ